MDTQTVLTAVLVLLVWIGLFGMVAWVISTALVHIIEWLRKQKQVQRLGMVVSQSVRLWWNRHEAAVGRLLEFGWEVLVNPLFFAFVVYVLFNRITSITDYVAAHPETSFWQQLNLDMEQDLNFYMWVLVIFIIWMLVGSDVNSGHQSLHATSNPA